MTALYVAGLVARCDQRPIDIIESLAEAMAGKVVFVGNQLLMRAGSYTAPVLTLGDDAMVGQPEVVQSGTPRQDLFNIVDAKLIDDQQDWKPDVDMPQVRAGAYITTDGAELPLDLQFEAIHSAGQAQQVAAVMLRYARDAMTITARFNMKAYRVQVFDIITLTCSSLGISREFIVMNRKWALGSAIELTLRAISPATYLFGDTFEAIDPTSNTSLPLPTSVAQLTELAVESGTPVLADGSMIARTRVSWTPSTDLAVIQNGRVEVQYRRLIAANTDDWPSVTEQGGASTTTIEGLVGGDTYVIRARFINGNGVRGMWSAQVTHLVAAARSVMVGYLALAADHLIDNNSFVMTGTGGVNKITVQSDGRPILVHVQVSMVNTHTNEWFPLNVRIQDGLNDDVLFEADNNWLTGGTQPGYRTDSYVFYDQRTTVGERKYFLSLSGGPSSGTTALAGQTYIMALR
jgi:hypothetical protein